MQAQAAGLRRATAAVRSPGARARDALAARLRKRRAEIEDTALTRVKAIADPTGTADPSYLEGLREAVAAAVEHGIAAVQTAGEREPPIPLPLLAQARNAARNGVSLDTVLRRYFAGYSLLGHFLIEESSGEPLPASDLKSLLATQASLLDRLVAAISDEYAREKSQAHGGSEARRARLVERLLAGEHLDPSSLGYPVGVSHVAAVAVGRGAGKALLELAASVDCTLLLVPRGNETAWAWFGARRPLDPEALLRCVPRASPDPLAIALGEPGEGLAGWRLTHRQASCALPVARRLEGNAARYGEVALIAAALGDEVLLASLRDSYLLPLDGERSNGDVLRETLRTYIALGCNASSTAARLGVRRQTVTSRLRTVEDLVGVPLDSCLAELDLALRMDQLNTPEVCGQG